MKCPKCGGVVGERDLYCEKCGKSLRKNIEAKSKIIMALLVLGAGGLGYLVLVNIIQNPGNNQTVPQAPLHAPTIVINSIGMGFVLIPADKFDMGSPLNEKSKFIEEGGPVRHVNISKAVYMGQYEVTQKQWRNVMGTSPSYFTGDDLPVEAVSWKEVQEFIINLNKREETNKYRLPSEAEWEYAARAGTATRYSFGDDESKLGDYAWYYDNSNNKTHPVGEKKPNPWGLYDIYGNVWEWVQDKWHKDYNNAPTDGSSWEDGNDSHRVYRGGSLYEGAGFCRSALRRHYDPGLRRGDLGFRLVREL